MKKNRSKRESDVTQSEMSKEFKKPQSKFKKFNKEVKKPKLSKEEFKEKRKQRKLKSSRVIVRNLPFKSDENSIKQHFSTCGQISEVNLLKKGDKYVGCGFIQFENRACAAKAIAKLSGKEFMGRPIIVDWALPKNIFAKNIKNELGASKPGVKVKNTSSSENEDSDEGSEDAEEGGDDDRQGIKFEEDEGERTEDEEESEGSDDERQGIKSEEDEGERTEDEEESEGSAESDSEDSKQAKNKAPLKNKKYHFQYDPQDVSDGRTVFLKNVPFSANDDDLYKSAQEVGPVIYAVICMDHLTEHSKGTGFVKFQDKSVVDDLIQGKKKLVVKGVTVEVFLALKKDKLGEKNAEKGPKDKRNIYLLREGLILAGSPAAEGVSEGDMAKRLQLEHWKTLALRNLTKFVSPIRLAVHNLPPFVDDSKLKQIFKENSPKGSIITESRVIRNLKDIDEKGVGKSKGFGFVTFTRHEHALAALRKINNNPHIFKDNKRPIVGFSIEKKIALLVKEKRKLKSQNIQKNKSENKTPGGPSTSSKEDKKRKFSAVEEDLPEFVGNVAKPGVKKMRSRKELSVQAALHHKAVVEKKRQKKRKIHFGRKFKNRNNSKR